MGSCVMPTVSLANGQMPMLGFGVGTAWLQSAGCAGAVKPRVPSSKMREYHQCTRPGGSLRDECIGGSFLRDECIGGTL